MAALERRFGSRDGLLVARVAAGDESALAALYDRFGALVHGIALRVTCERGLAEEVTQDVFVSLWQRPEAVDPTRGSVRTWLATVAHRRAVDRVRSTERARARDRVSAIEEDAAEPVDVAETVASAERARRVWAAVDALPEAQRAAVRLAYAEGRSYREVADQLDLPEGTAKSRLRLGLRRLAELLAEEAPAWS
jgi:RNA polymerase sigma factor (sigma-70 family)